MPDDDRRQSLRAATAVIFWQDIALIAEAVRALIAEDGATLRNLPSRLRLDGIVDQNSRRELIRRLLLCTKQLMSMQTRRPATAPGAEPDGEFTRMQSWLAESSRARGLSPTTPLPTSASDADVRRDEVLMESLTACWLALYFLGIPFVHPWERVRRIADDRGGYPSGICISKYIGDIYRSARQQLTINRRVASEMAPATVPALIHASTPIIVLSFSPMAIVEKLLDVSDQNNRTPEPAHLLGRCYSMLQMRLYLNEGFPIKYFVSIESLQQAWDSLTERPREQAFASWVSTIFPHLDAAQSVYVLMRSDKISDMPQCILGTEVGLYVLDTSHVPVPFAGNQIIRSMLQSYRDKLTGLEQAPNNAQQTLSLNTPDAIGQLYHRLQENLQDN